MVVAEDGRTVDQGSIIHKGGTDNFVFSFQKSVRIQELVLNWVLFEGSLE